MALIAQIKALSDETRLRIYAILLSHELNVNDIVEILEVSQPRVSRHLKILADAGLVLSRRDGLWVFYKAANHQTSANILKNLIMQDSDMTTEMTLLEEKIVQKAREKTIFYDSLAPRWDALKEGIFGTIHTSREIIRRLTRCNVAADLGCGTGDLLPLFAEKAQRVIGIDRSPKMLDEAKRRLKDNSAHIELRIGELEHLPMRDGETNAAVLNMVLHHLTEPHKGIREASRAIAKGGQCIIVELDKHNREEFRTSLGHRWLGFPQKLMKEWLAQAGFMVQEMAGFKTDTGLGISIYVSHKK
jgi:ArsR family transcriptional regulator